MIQTREAKDSSVLSGDLQVALENLNRLASELEEHGITRLETPELHRWKSIVQKYFSLLDQWRSGEAEQERQAAKEVLATLRRFNRTVKTLERDFWAWVPRGIRSDRKNLSSSIIPIPPVRTRRRRFRASHGKNSPYTAQKFAELGRTEPTQQELDAFRMKGLTLMQAQTPLSSSAEALARVRNRPVKSTRHQVAGSTETVVALSQEIPSLFPGERFKLEGSFRRLPNSKLSIPIPESFQLLSESRQTGFPHPSQHTGWALHEALLPESSDLPRMQNLLEAKWRLARALLPEGRSVARAKELLHIRRKTFLAHIETFAPLYKALLRELFPNAEFSYLDQLASKKHPFLTLCHTHQVVMDRYVGRLKDYILQTRILHQRHRDRHIRSDLEDFLEKLHQRQERKIKKAENEDSRLELQYIHGLGKGLGPLAIELLLHHQTGSLGLAPSPLSEPACRLELMAIHQILAFLREIQASTEMTEDRMLAKMHEELSQERELLERPLPELLKTPAGLILAEQLSH